MRLSDFDYNLDEKLIAQYPVKAREKSRLLVLNRKSGEIKHRVFSDITDYLNRGDLLLLNNTKVLPARLFGKKAKTGGRVEVLLLKRVSKNRHADRVGINKNGCISPSDPSLIKGGRGRYISRVDRWEALIKGRTNIGQEIIFEEGLTGRITGYRDKEIREIVFSSNENPSEILQRIGKTPLPPYIKRGPEEIGSEDTGRYQTVYARHDGSIAAPTAGLHFTNKLLRKIELKGVEISYITLHIGRGTFQPVREDNIERHKMETEDFEVTRNALAAIRMAINEGRRIITTGTTSTRVIESVIEDIRGNHYEALKGNTDLFIYPGYRFKAINGLITNLHLPMSTLFMLVSAFAGTELIKKAYDEAVKNRYRFYSYGDAMLIM
ncbi:MAG: tRNA preQ1(34) S-adenosylmethionine ribosyltransferase-isomerase QueA [Nitrospirota bacterium]